MNASPMDLDATISLLAFWRDAGVDACCDEAPIDRTRVEPSRANTAVLKAAASAPAPVNSGDAIVEARRLAAQADTLDALAQAVALFEGCPLSRMGARQSVFGRGAPHAPVLVIGEGPGAEEDARGQPFVGKAGQLLDRMLDAAGLGGKVFITNTVFWRPPGNRTPTPQEQAVCAPFVERAFAILKPKAVLLLGAAAAKCVLKTDEGVMRLRGQWRTWRLAEAGPVPSTAADRLEPVSAPVMPTLHPAFLLRQPQAKKQAWADLLALTAALDGEDGAAAAD